MLPLGRIPIMHAICYGNSAAYNISLGHLDAADEAAREALRWGRKAQSTPLVAFGFQHLAAIAALRDETQLAARLRGYVDILLQELGIHRQRTEKWSYEKLMTALRAHLSEAEIEKLAAEGAAWSEDQAVEEAFKV